VTMSKERHWQGPRRASFIVRVVRDRRGQVSGVIERVATGAKEAFKGSEAIGQTIGEMFGASATEEARDLRHREW
jgi:hypothetical protein